MVKTSDPIGPLATAQSLAKLGLQVLPARYQHELKAPTIPWKKHTDKLATPVLLASWFKGTAPKNFWVMTGGISGVVVIDCDNAEADAWWRETLGDAVLSATTQSRTSKGTHYWFRIPESWRGKSIKSWSKHPLKEGENRSFDFRADGTGVIAPPSVHETGVVYTWTVPFSQLQDAPEALLDGTLRTAAPGQEAGVTMAAPVVARIGPGGRTGGLSDLLASPPSEGGRNVWLTNVAGHIAQQFRGNEDLYRTFCAEANGKLSPPLDGAEYEKTVSSIWASEQGKPQDQIVGIAAWDEDAGWLRGHGRRIVTQTRRPNPEEGGDPIYEAGNWADFDAKCLGIIIGDEGEENDYWVSFLRTNSTDPLDTVLPGKILGDTGRLTAWLANKRMTILPPDNLFPRSGGYGVRLQRYLESQNPPKMRTTQQLGWSATALQGAGGFITFDNVLTATQKLPFTEAGIRPDPRMRGQGAASHHYGFSGSKKEARAVLREVLTFHEETACSVFGAWWAACLLKPQLQGGESGMFPFMALEAASESGKTSGFFNMMVKLNGSTRGQAISTHATLRNSMAAHHNGIVWIDDMDEPGRTMELLRAATAGGSISKQGGDGFDRTIEFHLVAPVFLSGESLGVSNQKALADRAVQIKVSSPTSRMSLKDPTKLQWADMEALEARYPNGLSALSGWYVQLALQQEPQARVALTEAKSVAGRGRAAKKNAVLLAGAMLLDSLVASSPDDATAAWKGAGTHYGRVVAWVKAQQGEYHEQDNALTMEVLPWALRHFNMPDKPEYREDGRSDPVFVEGYGDAGKLGGAGPVVWFNVDLLASAWAREHRGKVQDRVHSADSLQKQVALVRAGTSKLKRMVNGKPLRFAQIGGDMALRVITLAQGV